MRVIPLKRTKTQSEGRAAGFRFVKVFSPHMFTGICLVTPAVMYMELL